MTTAGPASLPDWPYKSTPALALDEGAHIGTVQLLVSRPTLRKYSAGTVGTSGQPAHRHCAYRSWPAELGHLQVRGRTSAAGGGEEPAARELTPCPAVKHPARPALADPAHPDGIRTSWYFHPIPVLAAAIAYPPDRARLPSCEHDSLAQPPPIGASAHHRDGGEAQRACLNNLVAALRQIPRARWQCLKISGTGHLANPGRPSRACLRFLANEPPLRQVVRQDE
jgi:hypothetical protein